MFPEVLLCDVDTLCGRPDSIYHRQDRCLLLCCCYRMARPTEQPNACNCYLHGTTRRAFCRLFSTALECKPLVIPLQGGYGYPVKRCWSLCKTQFPPEKRQPNENKWNVECIWVREHFVGNIRRQNVLRNWEMDKTTL